MCSRVSARARSESTAWPQSCFWQRSRISSAPVPVIDRKQFSRVDELFDAALDKPPEERASFLGEACAGDAALREEVQKLLELSGQRGFALPERSHERADLGRSCAGAPGRRRRDYRPRRSHRPIRNPGSARPRGAWEVFTVRKIPTSSAKSPSRFCREISPPIARRSAASSARPSFSRA